VPATRQQGRELMPARGRRVEQLRPAELEFLLSASWRAPGIRGANMLRLGVRTRSNLQR
jgi:hypothetical protein